MAFLRADKASTEIFFEYLDYADIFLANFVMELPKDIDINDYAIKLVESKQLFYEPIYSLDPVELETLKTYIETHLKTGFIQPSKSPARASIFFKRKSNSSFCLRVDYQSLNNLTIKNLYLFFDR